MTDDDTVYVAEAYRYENGCYERIERAVHTTANGARTDLHHLLDGRSYDKLTVDEQQLYTGENGTRDTMTVPRDAVGQWIFDLAMEHAEHIGPSMGDGRSEWHMDDDDIPFPSFDDVDTIDTAYGEKHLEPHRHSFLHDDYEDDDTPILLFHGMVQASESRKVSRPIHNPPSQAHPEEYESRDVPLMFTLAVPMTDPFSDEGVCYMERT